MYKYLSLNKEGFNKEAGFLGIGDTVKELKKQTETSNEEVEPESLFQVKQKIKKPESATTAENMGQQSSNFNPRAKYTSTKNNGQKSTGDKEPTSNFNPRAKYTSTKNNGQKSTGDKEPTSNFNPSVKPTTVKNKDVPAPSTVKQTNPEQRNNPAPVTVKVMPLPEVKKPTEPEEMTYDPAAADKIDIPEVKQNPDAKIPGPEDQIPAETEVSVLPLNVEDSEIPDPAELKVTVPEPPPLQRFGYLDPASTSIAEDIFSAQNLRNNVLPGVGIAAGIGGLAGAFMDDSNPIMTALGTGAGAGAGTLLWDYLSRNEDTQKYIKDFQEWAGKNLWEGANGHVKYLAPALGGLAGLLISK